MGKKTQRGVPKVPWITESGTLDPTKFPIEPVLRQTVGEDFEDFRSGCVFLGTMACHGRVEAGVYLLGLLKHCRDDLGRLEVVVESLGAFRTEVCAKVLFEELRRVKGSNATRRYRDQVIRTLTRFPSEIVEAEFEALATDPSFSYRMRRKFAEAGGRLSSSDASWNSGGGG